MSTFPRPITNCCEIKVDQQSLQTCLPVPLDNKLSVGSRIRPRTDQCPGYANENWVDVDIPPPKLIVLKNLMQTSRICTNLCHMHMQL